MHNPELYFDPFADEGEQLFDPTVAFQELEQRYVAGDVEHDYTADNFVRDAEALMLDAVFVERFDAMQEIAARMHELCVGNHELNQAFQDSEFLSGLPGEYIPHDAHDHNHEEAELVPKTGKKVKKKKTEKKRSWLFGSAV